MRKIYIALFEKSSTSKLSKYSQSQWVVTPPNEKWQPFQREPFVRLGWHFACTNICTIPKIFQKFWSSLPGFFCPPCQKKPGMAKKILGNLTDAADIGTWDRHATVTSNYALRVWVAVTFISFLLKTSSHSRSKNFFATSYMETEEFFQQPFWYRLYFISMSGIFFFHKVFFDNKNLKN